MDRYVTWILIFLIAVFFVGSIAFMKGEDFTKYFATSQTAAVTETVETPQVQPETETSTERKVNLPAIFGIATVALCIMFWYLTAKGIVDNGPQYAVTVGVAFTFIGIIIALYNFKVDNVEEIRQSISAFLDGMKTAFITSIIGIGFSLLIGIFTKSKVEKRDKKTLTEHFKNISDNTGTILTFLKDTSGSGESLKTSLDNLSKTLDGSSLGILKKELGNLSDVMKMYVDATKSSGEFLKTVSTHLSEQSKVTAALNETMSKSFTLQMQAINSLSKSLEESQTKQVARLDAMNNSIAQMTAHSQKTYENSSAMLNETRNYQAASLANDREQMQILSENTKRIIEMRNAFDEFLNKMATVFSEQLINALNSSIKDLNDKLTEQFGDNFKQLNAAVVALKDWQENYKSTIEQTVGELNMMNTAFKNFTVEVAPVMAENNERLSKSAESLAETSNKNVDIQLRLMKTSQNLFESVQATEKVADNLKDIHSTLVANQQEILTGIKNSFDNHTAQMITTTQTSMNNLRESMNNLNDTTLKVSVDMSDKVKHFDESVEQAMNQIGMALDNFNTDFRDEIEKAMKNLQVSFETIAKATGEQGEVAVKNLAAVLGKITERMVTNYTTLVDRIEKVDEILASRRSA